MWTVNFVRVEIISSTNGEPSVNRKAKSWYNEPTATPKIQKFLTIQIARFWNFEFRAKTRFKRKLVVCVFRKISELKSIQWFVSNDVSKFSKWQFLVNFSRIISFSRKKIVCANVVTMFIRKLIKITLEKWHLIRKKICTRNEISGQISKFHFGF